VYQRRKSKIGQQRRAASWEFFESSFTAKGLMMEAVLEHSEFSKYLNSKFRIPISDEQTVEAELVEVSELMLSARQERFSIVFRTSNEFFLGQGQRAMAHDQMGEFILFLVPVGRNEQGTSYEAVFNRLVDQRPAVPQ
jgi:hypothetical protein